MIVQAYFWASNAYILKTNLVTPIFFTLGSLSFENEATVSFKNFLRSGFSLNFKNGSLLMMKNSFRRNF